MADEVKTVRVVRTTTIERVETVDIVVEKKQGEYRSHNSMAEEFAKAAASVGYKLPWQLVSETPQTYPAPSIETDDAPVAAPLPPHLKAPSDEIEPS